MIITGIVVQMQGNRNGLSEKWGLLLVVSGQSTYKRTLNAGKHPSRGLKINTAHFRMMFAHMFDSTSTSHPK